MTHPFKFAVRSSRAGSGGELRLRARQAEDLGYYAFHVSDHVLGPGPAMERTGHPPAEIAAIPTLMAIADATKQLRVGARVMCIGYHHPVVLAKELSTIDFLSDGRLEVGLGAGWLRGEYEALGIPFDTAGERVDRLAEAITLMKALFGDGQVAFHGEYFQIEGFEGAPRPVQRPRPPIAVGGGSRRVLQLAARTADIVSLNYDNRSGLLGVEGVQGSTADFTSQKIAWIREAAGERFSELELEVGVYFTAVTDDSAEVSARLSSRFGLTAKDMMEHPHALIGSVDEICEDLLRRREHHGISYFTIGEDSAGPFAPVVERLAGR